jgi:alpha-1,3-fucosyltransferase
LKRYIKVDSYGDCGDLHLCKKSGDSGDSPESCYDLLESHGYKFYLSFENSLCTDYVTEKFFWILTRKIVPVVYGGADYSSIAPPHSYIDARLFEPQELANYLLILDSNETLYNEYFWWKDYYQVEAGQEQMVKRGFCDLCKKLHLMDAPSTEDISSINNNKIYDKMLNHWLPENQCEKPSKTFYSRK